MKVVKISKNHQVTIPKSFHHLCSTGFFALTTEDTKIILRPLEIKPAKTQQEFLDELNKSLGIKMPWEK